MCGIAGYVHKNSCTAACTEIENLVHKVQACRGPDSQNSWFDERNGTTIHLHHQRLRIQDLSSAADQPMHSTMNDSMHIVLNGEIYNPEEIRKKFLGSCELRTHSDTEILVESLALHDTEDLLKDIRGMFAIGAYSSTERTLKLIRDRFGEKPLHYGFGTDFIFFASQFDAVADALKILRKSLELNQEAIYEYLILGYFPFGSSLFRNIHKVPAGTCLNFDLNHPSILSPSIATWQPQWKVKNQEARPFEVLEEGMLAAIGEQLIGDVPIGVFLSGGVDSTFVSAIAQKLHDHPIHSFSLGFENKAFDESIYALKAANQLGTEHHAITMTAEDALAILPTVLKAYPEPLGDPSVFPTLFISKEASKYVKVVLTGDGADELFFGYGRYARYLELRKSITHVPILVKILIRMAGILSRFNTRWSNRLKRISQLSQVDDKISVYLSLVGFAHYQSAINPTAFLMVLRNLKLRISRLSTSSSPFDSLREIDVSTYLIDDILVKIDRAAMAFGLETRAPFLDSRISHLSMSATPDWLFLTEQKHVLKHLLSKYVSEDIFMRTKMGFGAPIGEWLRTSLKPWAEDLVYKFDWKIVGINEEFVHKIWKENQNSNDSSGTYLWMLLALAFSVSRYE